ncbi:MAG: hypothetical protein M3R62_00785 [Acidobacteriota bacterium]|nr:hypothetical protein [Acidobacteriota bacterium]
MELLLCIWLAAGSPAPIPWNDLALSIEEDHSVSSDHATLCRVRVVNHGRGTWQGHDVVFEARAIREGRVAARQRGRFGWTIGPHETLETLVGFLGRFDRFEVGPIPVSASRQHSAGGKAGGKRARSRASKSAGHRRR